MTLLEGLQNQVSNHLKGVQIFGKDKLIDTIKKHNLVFANDVKIDSDEQGEHLILTFDDQIVCFELTWRQDGPKCTLVDIRLA